MNVIDYCENGLDELKNKLKACEKILALLSVIDVDVCRYTCDNPQGLRKSFIKPVRELIDYILPDLKMPKYTDILDIKHFIDAHDTYLRDNIEARVEKIKFYNNAKPQSILDNKYMLIDLFEETLVEINVDYVNKKTSAIFQDKDGNKIVIKDDTLLKDKLTVKTR